MSDIYDDIENGLQDALKNHEISRVNRWVVVIETLDEDGTRGLWCLSNKDSRPWDTKGMLAHAMDYEVAKSIQSVVGRGE